MSFDDIQLPPALLADLYKNSLVQLDAEQPVEHTQQKSATNIKYLGENRKSILIMVDDNTSPFLHENAFTLLLNILTACRLNMGDVALVNKATMQIPLTHLQQQLSSKIVLLFGIEARDMNLPIDFPHYQVQKHGNITYLTSNDFETLETDKQQKGKLWLCLKKIFGI